VIRRKVWLLLVEHCDMRTGLASTMEKEGMKANSITLRDCNTRILFVLITALLMLGSCSHMEVKVRRPAVCVNMNLYRPDFEKPETPYCQIDYDYPLTAVFDPKVYIYKHDRRLLVVENGVLVRDYHIALGPHPDGDKYLRGDGRTPEGEFYVCLKNPLSQYYKSLGLSYPGPKHAEEAIQAGAITFDEFQEILTAYESKGTPPWNTPLGGSIFIHGGGAGDDWTLGCIAVNNSAMDELFEVLRVGTPVKIYP